MNSTDLILIQWNRLISPQHRASVMPSLLLMTSLIILPGCGGGPTGPQTYESTGTVTFDGNPVEEGRITFRMKEGGKGFSGEIQAGKYSVTTEAGEMEVSIIASREVPGQVGEAASPDEEPPPVKEMYIPEKYNDSTELTASVTSGGENKFDFKLEAE